MTEKTVKVEVVRAFCIGGEALKPGSVVEVSPALAIELKGLNKAIPFVEKKASAKKEDAK